VIDRNLFVIFESWVIKFANRVGVQKSHINYNKGQKLHYKKSKRKLKLIILFWLKLIDYTKYACVVLKVVCTGKGYSTIILCSFGGTSW